MDLWRRESIARSVNRSLDWLAPGPGPVTSQGVKDLIRRFRKDTMPIDQDRNRARAHRFESTADLSFFQSLPQIEKQLETFQAYVSPLHHVLTRNSMSFKLSWGSSSSGRAAEDLADIMVHGSINRACNAYGVPRKTPENLAPWYWKARHRYFVLGPSNVIRSLLSRLVGVLKWKAER